MVFLAGWGPWTLLGSSASGHKLRLNIPDTAIIEDGLLRGWLYTDRKTGVVQSTPNSSLSCTALLHKLKSQHALYDNNNPDGWVAVAYYDSFVTRLLNAHELEQLLAHVYVGALPDELVAAGQADESGPQLLAVQAYVVPDCDVRYLTTFGGVEGASTLTQSRKYSHKFSAGPSQAAAAEAAALIVHQATATAAASATAALQAQQQVDGVAEGSASRTSSMISLSQHSGLPIDAGNLWSCSPQAAATDDGADEAAVDQIQLSSGADSSGGEILLHAASSPSQETCATPTLPAGTSWRQAAADSVGGTGFSYSGVSAGTALHVTSGSNGMAVGTAGLPLSDRLAEDAASGSGGSAESASAAGRVKAAPSSVSKAAAAAVQVLISYLDKAHGLRVTGLASEFVLDPKQQLWLIGLHHIAVDPVLSKGSTTTFTERWEEFLAGTGPPPAPQLAQNTAYATTAHQTASRSAAENPNQGTTAAVIGARAEHPGCHQSIPASMNGIQQLTKQFFPLLTVDLEHLTSCRPQSATASLRTGAGPARPSSAPRCLRSTSPQLICPSGTSNRQRPGSSLVSSADCATMSSGSALSSSLRSGGPKCTSRNEASAARPGAGGNPTNRSNKCDSYMLWLQQPARPADSITAQLAGQLEYAKEQVQHYADLAEAVRLQADEATQQAAQQVASVQQELLLLRHDAAAASRERRQLQQQTADIEHQRNGMQQGMAQMHQQLMGVQEQLAQDRATMATMLREHQQQKQQHEAEFAALHQHNADLQHSCQQLTARLDEESEVVSALRAQLVDYKLQMEQMNLQSKKGRSLYTSNSMALRRGGSNTPPGQLQGAISLSGGAVPPGGLTLSGLNSSAGGFGSDAGMASNRLASSRSATANAAVASGRTFLPSASGTSSKLEQYMNHNRATMNSNPVSRRNTCEHALPAVTGAPAGPAASSSAVSGTAGRAVPAVCGTAPKSIDVQPVQVQPPKSPSPVESPSSIITLQQVPATVSGLASARSANSQTTSSPACEVAIGASPQEQQPQAQQPQTSLSQQQQQQNKKATAHDTHDPDAAVSCITAAISASLGEQLIAGAKVKPQLFIADLLCDGLGALEPKAEQQLAVLSGLLQEVHGDLLEIFSYYATLGSVQVVADRMTMELLQFGKLAYDLNIPQDNKSLSAVEDAFYVLSDRRPCLALKNKTRPPSAEATHKSSRPGGSGGSNPGACLLGAAAAAATASGTAYLGPGTQHAVARAAAWDNRGGMSRKDSYANPTAAAAAAAAVMVTMLGQQEVIVPEQFAEALIRLACVRYRWGVINTEYDWDDDDDWEDEYEQLIPRLDEDGMPAGSSRMQRQQQHQQQEESRRRGPRVLKPEGQDLYTDQPPAVASSTRRPASPCRTKAPASGYAVPSGADDLVTVVTTFLQHEVLKHARRNKLAGSPLGHRRARSRSPAGTWRPAAT